MPSTSGSNSFRLLDPVSVRCQTKIVCGHEDIEKALSTETSHRYTVKSHKHNCLATISISKLKQNSSLHDINGTKIVHIWVKKKLKHPYAQTNQGSLSINCIPCERSRAYIRTDKTTNGNHMQETHEPPWYNIVIMSWLQDRASTVHAD